MKKHIELCLKRIKSVSGEFGDGLGAFRNGVFGEFSGEDQFNGALDLSGRQSVLLVVSDQFGGLNGDSVERVGDEGVHDVHGLLGDSGFGVHLLQHLVDVDSEGLHSSFVFSDGDFLDLLLGGGGLLGGHFY